MGLNYNAPLEDIRFVIETLLEAPKDWKRLGMESDLDSSMAVLEAAGDFCSKVMGPLNAVGDQQGCKRSIDGSVKTPDGFKSAFELYREQGWPGLACSAEHGGQGLPQLVQASFDEMQAATCQAFGMYPLLSLGAYECIARNGSELLRALYLPKLASGEWTGTMCLTEPHCGTDLGLMRTKADGLPEGNYSISGTKIFISAGEHDLAGNIVHLVLARISGAPKGTKGISLFCVPKLLADGSKNGISCARLEEKMGIHGNSTCEMLLERAIGELVGEPNQGLKAMFVMMNGARLGVAMQGVGISEASHQAALAYAKDRRQSRSLKGAADPESFADRILVHPDVRRMLLTIRAHAESGRMLSYWAAHLSDLCRHGADEQERSESLRLLSLLTPICKARLTDQGFESANLAIQVHGGHGFIREHGVEQLARDSRINMIYEGTNGIQALDLVARKVLPDQGKGLRALLAPIEALVDAHGADGRAARWTEPLGKAALAFAGASMQVGMRSMSDLDEAGAACNDFLNAAACLLEGMMFCKAGCALLDRDDDFAQSKRALADFYFDKLFPEAISRIKTMGSGNKSLAAAKDEWL